MRAARPAHEGWLRVHAELPSLHREKVGAYGRAEQPFLNLDLVSAASGKPRAYYMVERIIEKAVRVLHLIDAGAYGDRIGEELRDMAHAAIAAEAARREDSA